MRPATLSSMARAIAKAAPMSRRVALYGGSFDPIHHGHLIVARSVSEQLDLDKVVFLPSASPPHKSGESLADPSRRAEMVKLAIEGEPQFELSDFDLVRAGPSYTIETVEHFRQTFGDQTALFWIIGADSLGDLKNWHRIEALVDGCQLVTAARPGWDQVDWSAVGAVLNDERTAKLRRGEIETPHIDISSTDIRRRTAAHRSIRYLVTEAVAEYINLHSLYRSEA